MAKTAIDKAVKSVFEGVEEEKVGGLEDLPEGDDLPRREPTMDEPTWSDFVLAQFEPDELNENGNPYVFGLRRVARKLLGPILKSSAKVVQPPLYMEGGTLGVATVEYTVSFLWKREEEVDNGRDPLVVEFADCADVHEKNTSEFVLNHPSATASTRAEGRCYRKALQVKGVIAAEEEGSKGKSVNPSFITDTQLTALGLIASQINVNVVKYANMGKFRYDSLRKIPYSTAQSMVQKLNDYRANPKSIPTDIRGYDSKWREVSK